MEAEEKEGKEVHAGIAGGGEEERKSWGGVEWEVQEKEKTGKVEDA